jgi:curved DNA-binding protein CbpA
VTSGTERTLYQAMGVSPSADAAELREAYLRLARTLHPDRYESGSPGEKRLAERRMREVNAAWEVLGRPDSRAQYDADLYLRRRDEARARRTSNTTATSPSAARAPRPPVDTTEISEDDDVELSALTAFLLRRGPIIVLMFIALGLFVGTALARHGDPASTTTTSVSICGHPGPCADTGQPGGG